MYYNSYPFTHSIQLVNEELEQVLQYGIIKIQS